MFLVFIISLIILFILNKIRYIRDIEFEVKDFVPGLIGFICFIFSDILVVTVYNETIYRESYLQYTPKQIYMLICSIICVVSLTIIFQKRLKALKVNKIWTYLAYYVLFYFGVLGLSDLIGFFVINKDLFEIIRYIMEFIVFAYSYLGKITAAFILFKR